MSFDTVLKSAVEDLFSHLGESATFIGSYVVDPCTVIVDKDVENQPDLMTGQVFERRTVLSCLYDECGEPNPDDTFIVGDTTYTVQGTASNDGYTVELYVS